MSTVQSCPVDSSNTCFILSVVQYSTVIHIHIEILNIVFNILINEYYLRLIHIDFQVEQTNEQVQDGRV